MKSLLTTFTTIIAIGMFTTAFPVLAQTPDNETPANEGVCDEVFFSTPGLYGLCVAFCEAQDYAALDQPITEADLDALESAAPSGRILAAYNRKKRDADPEMPCILVEEPCPCWSAEEIASMDGLGASGNEISISCPSDPGIFSRVLENPPLRLVQAWSSAHSNGGACGYADLGTARTFRFLTVAAGHITSTQADQCILQVEAQAAAVCP